MHVIHSVLLLRHVSVFLYGDHQVVLQTYKKGTCFSGSDLFFTVNEYRISITSLLRVFQNCGLIIIIIKYGLEIIKSACAAAILLGMLVNAICCSKHPVLLTGGSAFKYVDEQWK